MQPGPSSPRGCVVVAVGPGGDRSDAARRLIAGVVHGLAVLARRGALDPVEVDGAVVSAAGSLLRGTTPDWPFVPLRKMTSFQIRYIDGCDAANGALAGAAAAVQGWLLRQDHPLRPLVVYCTDESGIAADAALPARSLRQLGVPAGPLLLATCGFSVAIDRVVAMPSRKEDIPDTAWRDAWAVSSRGHTAAGAETHALALNDPSPAAVIRLVRHLCRQGETAPRSWPLQETMPVACETRVLWAPRDGNSDDEYEDGFALDPEQGRAVVSDGASAGIFTRRWVETLMRHFLATNLDLADAGAIHEWVSACRRDWREAIRYPDLHGLQQDKVDATGAAATFLAFALQRRDGRLRWRAAAVGDSCLFVVRDGQLVAAVPLCRAADFGFAPDLIPTLRRLCPKVRFVTAEGLGKLGDLYGLATDAMAQYLLRSHEMGQSIDWQQYWDMDEGRWRAELARLRESGQIVNDDATLVLLRVRG